MDQVMQSVYFAVWLCSEMLTSVSGFNKSIFENMYYFVVLYYSNSL